MLVGTPIQFQNHAMYNGKNFLAIFLMVNAILCEINILLEGLKIELFSWFLFKTCISEHFVLPFCLPTFFRCLSRTSMPLPFFCKGLAQHCSPIAIARLVCTCDLLLLNLVVRVDRIFGISIL